MPYVGCILTKGKTVEERFYDHCTSSGGAPYLRRAIRKHGKAWFQVEQIDVGNTLEQTLELEKWWIKRLGTKAPQGGYNLTEGGTGVDSVTATEIAKKRAITPEGKAHLARMTRLKNYLDPVNTARLRAMAGTAALGTKRTDTTKYVEAAKRRWANPNDWFNTGRAQ